MPKKEDPDENSAQADQSQKDKKQPPPKKGKPDDKQDAEDLSPEEEERRRKEIEERERKNLRLQEHWNGLSDEDKFYGTAENNIKEHHIAFPPVPKEGGEPDEMELTNVQTITLTHE